MPIRPRHRGLYPFDWRQTPRAEAGETVLVVDDEPTVRMLVADVLADLGYSAIEAEDRPSGLRALAAAGRVDPLVTDVGLPGGRNGRQVADAARALRAGLKVLFIAGLCRERRRRKRQPRSRPGRAHKALRHERFGGRDQNNH